MDAAGTKHATMVMRFLKDKQGKLNKIEKTSGLVSRTIPVAVHKVLNACVPERIAEKLEDRSIDRALERAVAKLEMLQDLTKSQLRELATIGDQLDRLLKHPSPKVQ